MKVSRVLTAFLFFLAVSNVQAQNNFGGEIVSYNTFGEGMMVTRAKIVPLSGVVTNMFFYNRADEPWLSNSSEWYEYDWEIRGAYPFAGWSQIRVRDQGETILKDAPVDVSTTTNLGDELLHYILIRKNDLYVYDIRRDFDVNTYNYNSAEAHGGNSESLLSDGPRVYETGGTVSHIPSWKELDFSLGITAFGTKWAGSLPEDNYSREAEVDFARFYTFSGSALNTDPQWYDEFSGSSLDFGKWYTANWTFSATQFRQENVKVEGGRLFLRVNRGESFWNPVATKNSVVLTQNDFASEPTQSLPEPQVIIEPQVIVEPQAIVEPQVVAEPQVMPELQVTPELQVVNLPRDNSASTAVASDSVQTGSTDPMTLFMLAVCGLTVAQRRRLQGRTRSVFQR